MADSGEPTCSKLGSLLLGSKSAAETKCDSPTLGKPVLVDCPKNGNKQGVKKRPLHDMSSEEESGDENSGDLNLEKTADDMKFDMNVDVKPEINPEDVLDGKNKSTVEAVSGADVPPKVEEEISSVNDQNEAEIEDVDDDSSSSDETDNDDEDESESDGDESDDESEEDMEVTSDAKVKEETEKVEIVCLDSSIEEVEQTDIDKCVPIDLDSSVPLCDDADEACVPLKSEPGLPVPSKSETVDDTINDVLNSVDCLPVDEANTGSSKELSTSEQNKAADSTDKEVKVKKRKRKREKGEKVKGEKRQKLNKEKKIKEKKNKDDKSRKSKLDRKNIRKIMEETELEEETRTAQQEEIERKKRLQEQQKKLQNNQCLKALLETSDEDDEEKKSSGDTEKKHASASKPVRDVINISSDEDDIVIMSDKAEEDDEDDVSDDENGGLHVDDTRNLPDESGQILVNLGHPDDEPDIYLAPQLARVVKPHQIGGIRFLYDNLVESVNRLSKSNGFGCILAHSMGLGKTIQVISFIDVFLRHTAAHSVLVIVPINTLQNWIHEFDVWLPTAENLPPDCPQDEVRPRGFSLFVLNDNHKNMDSRAIVVDQWQRTGGVLLMGYEMYRLLATRKPKQQRKPKKPKGPILVDLEEEDRHKELAIDMQVALLSPGPDLVICDEGHRIKNSGAGISKALKEIRTKRRVVLTGYPLQNNLLEYWCMVDFVRPNFLGTKLEFSNMFERPIMNAQCMDSTPEDVKVMRERAHVLHSLLEGFVQRRGHAVLKLSLPIKHECVIMVRMSPIQRRLYTEFMNIMNLELESWASMNPLKAFSVCCKIWNHPDVLFKVINKKNSELDNDLDIADDETGKKKGKGKKKKNVKKEEAASSGQEAMLMGEDGFFPFEDKRDTVITYDWAAEILRDYIPGLLENSGKFTILFSLVNEAITLGEKLLIFSQSLMTLNLIEEFLSREQVPSNFAEKWTKNKHYFRLDGSTSGLDREKMINSFNNPENTNLHLFLLSTKAGCLGINLIGANRVLIMDASWNPCHDAQAVCRVYRYGQTKPCYIYRLVTDNTLEQKIYQRQVSKQTVADRVVDELNPQSNFMRRQVDTLLHYEDKDLPTIEPSQWSETEAVVNDAILENVLHSAVSWLTKVPFNHESLLIDQKEYKLTKAEKRLARQRYEREKKRSLTYTRPSYAAFYPQMPGGHFSTAMMRPNPLISNRRPDMRSLHPSMSTPIPMQPNMRTPGLQSDNPALQQLQNSGVSVHQVVTTTDIIMPGTNTSTDSSQPAKIPAGQQIMVIKTQKGVYIRTKEGRIFAVRSNKSLLDQCNMSNMTSQSGGSMLSYEDNPSGGTPLPASTTSRYPESPSSSRSPEFPSPYPSISKEPNLPHKIIKTVKPPNPFTAKSLLRQDNTVSSAAEEKVPDKEKEIPQASSNKSLLDNMLSTKTSSPVVSSLMDYATDDSNLEAAAANKQKETKSSVVQKDGVSSEAVMSKTSQLLPSINFPKPSADSEESMDALMTRNFSSTSLSSMTSKLDIGAGFLTGDESSNSAMSVKSSDNLQLPGGNGSAGFQQNAPNTAGSAGFQSAPNTAGSAGFQSAPNTAGSAGFQSAPNTAGSAGFQSAPNTAGSAGFQQNTPNTAGSTGFQQSAPNMAGSTGFQQNAPNMAVSTGFQQNAPNMAVSTGFQQSTPNTAVSTGFQQNAPNTAMEMMAPFPPPAGAIGSEVAKRGRGGTRGRPRGSRGKPREPKAKGPGRGRRKKADVPVPNTEVNNPFTGMNDMDSPLNSIKGSDQISWMGNTMNSSGTSAGQYYPYPGFQGNNMSGMDYGQSPMSGYPQQSVPLPSARQYNNQRNYPPQSTMTNAKNSQLGQNNSQTNVQTAVPSFSSAFMGGSTNASLGSDQNNFTPQNKNNVGDKNLSLDQEMSGAMNDDSIDSDNFVDTINFLDNLTAGSDSRGNSRPGSSLGNVGSTVSNTGISSSSSQNQISNSTVSNSVDYNNQWQHSMYSSPVWENGLFDQSQSQQQPLQYPYSNDYMNMPYGNMYSQSSQSGQNNRQMNYGAMSSYNQTSQADSSMQQSGFSNAYSSQLSSGSNSQSYMPDSSSSSSSSLQQNSTITSSTASSSSYNPFQNLYGMQPPQGWDEQMSQLKESLYGQTDSFASNK